MYEIYAIPTLGYAHFWLHFTHNIIIEHIPTLISSYYFNLQVYIYVHLKISMCNRAVRYQLSGCASHLSCHSQSGIQHQHYSMCVRLYCDTVFIFQRDYGTNGHARAAYIMTHSKLQLLGDAQAPIVDGKVDTTPGVGWAGPKLCSVWIIIKARQKKTWFQITFR